VVADYPCAALCPQNTVRIIHYDIEPATDACNKAGGGDHARRISGEKSWKFYCIPKALEPGDDAPRIR
jgi:hypothetical protein